MISGNVLWHPDRQTFWARSAWGQQRAGSGHRRSKCHGSPSWTVHPHLQGNIKISNICTKMLSPVVLTVQKWLNSRLKLYAQVVGVQEGKVKLQNNTADCHFGFTILQCGSQVWHFYAQASTWGGHISNTYQNRGSQHHGKNTQDSLNCLRWWFTQDFYFQILKLCHAARLSSQTKLLLS